MGGDGTFPFASQALGGFNLTTVNGTAQQIFSNLVPGAYDLSESVPAGWDLTERDLLRRQQPGQRGRGRG